MARKPTLFADSGANSALALGTGAIGALVLIAASFGRPHPFDAQLGVEAGFTVMVLGFLFARHELGFRGALIALMPAAAAQLVVLAWHGASAAWLGAELCVASLIELRARRRPALDAHLAEVS